MSTMNRRAILAGYGQVEYRYRAHPETLRE